MKYKPVKMKQTQNVLLSRYEIISYLIIWISGILYALYHLLKISSTLKTSDLPDLVPGWQWLGRKKDNTCPEWRLWTTYIIYSLAPWIVLHSLMLMFLKKYLRKIPILQDFWLVTVTSLCINYNFGLLPIFIYAGMTLIYYCLMFAHDKLIIWITSVFLLGVWSYYDFLFEYLDTNTNEENSYLLLLTLYWHQLRCISFALSSLERDSREWKNYIHFLAYSFYLPSFFFGPIIIYEKIIDTPKNYTNTKSLPKRVITLILNVIRYFGWMFVAEFVLHYIYVNMFLQNIKVIKNFGITALSGFGFTMGQFFFIKYTFVYGIAITIAQFDEYITPPMPPKCISRIHLYSDMWRSFDQGLYDFLKNYIYKPSGDYVDNVRLRMKIFRSFMCFVFVFIWHGLSWDVFLWTAFNYAGVTIETLARYAGKTTFYLQHVKGNINGRNERRFLALLTSPLTMMSAISNFFFFGGVEAGQSFLEVIFLKNTWIENMIILTVFYSMCHISVEFENYKKANKQKYCGKYNDNKKHIT
ncbi:protein-cysteine N-palmitoyltransferase HHAT [Adelges cooleyi]|uniref:protein-cysteine N-palmitoyltransferase HHAT n=1 Tax=Adelges cooleyi TaxID=133065 RepID=UPI00217F3231|nr:protein-cysteine N-palmitoyltransferase HHAT [Adelges cooleyi]